MLSKSPSGQTQRALSLEIIHFARCYAKYDPGLASALRPDFNLRETFFDRRNRRWPCQQNRPVADLSLAVELP